MADRSQRTVFVTTLDLSRHAGPTHHMAGVVLHLARAGHAITLLSPKPKFGPLAVELPDDVEHFHYPNVKSLGLPSGVGGFLVLAPLWRLRGARSVYVRSSIGTLPATAFASLFGGFGQTMVEHNGWLPDEITSFGYWRRLRRLFGWCQVTEAKLATRNRVVTEELGRLLVARGAPACKMHVIGNGTDTTVFHPMDQAECRRQLGLPERGRPILVFLGNLWPGAGLDVAFSAVRLLRDQDRPLDLIVAGDGIAGTSLRNLAAKMLGADYPVHFLGAVSARVANTVLGAADVALAPYLHERNAKVGVSALKVRAYAAAGRPCVASALPGVDALRAEPWMFLAEPGSPESLAGAIQRALACDWALASGSARRYAEEHFTWANVAANIDRLLADGCLPSLGSRSGRIPA